MAAYHAPSHSHRVILGLDPRIHGRGNMDPRLTAEDDTTHCTAKPLQGIFRWPYKVGRLFRTSPFATMVHFKIGQNGLILGARNPRNRRSVSTAKGTLDL